MALNLIEFIDLPNTTTPINANNLNNNFDYLEQGITDIETEISNIIENGSNENGNYIKFSDGTMICTNLVQMDTKNSTYKYQSKNWTFPIPFIEPPRVLSTVNNWTTYASFSKVLPNNSGTACNIMVHIMSTSSNSFVEASDFYSVNAVAIGKWK